VVAMVAMMAMLMMTMMPMMFQSDFGFVEIVSLMMFIESITP
jgi:hypothetical protein